MNARAEILAKVRAATQGLRARSDAAGTSGAVTGAAARAGQAGSAVAGVAGTGPAAEPSMPRPGDHRPNGLRARPRRTHADVVARFAERVAARRGPLRHVTADEVAVAMAAMLWALDARSVAVPADLPPAWLAGLETLDGVRLLDPAGGAPEAADAAVTGCRLAIAETGTVVLDGGRGQGRRALSLAPPHHLCVVHADQVVGTVRDAMERLDPYRPLTWLSDAPDGRTLGVLLIEG